MCIRDSDDPVTRGIGIDLDVVADGIGWEEPHHSRRVQPALGLDAVEHRQRVLVQLARGLSGGGVVQQCREPAGQLPGREKGLPVDIAPELRHGVVTEDEPCLLYTSRCV